MAVRSDRSIREPVDNGEDGGSVSLLDTATHSVDRWRVTEWDGCGEWSISAALPLSTTDSERPLPGHGVDPERARIESLRRTRASVRRYCSANRLDRMGTLTFEVEPDLDGGWEAVEGFRRALAAELGELVPLVVVPEYGTLNGRLHFHVAFGRYLPVVMLRRCWPHGFVDVRRIKARGRGRRLGGRALCRLVASYIAGYVTKGDRTPFSRKRYSTTRGCAPVSRSVMRSDLAAAFATVRARAGGAALTVWSSSSVEEWAGPPVYVIRDG